MEKKKRYTLYLGLNDKDERVQKFRTERIMELAANCCKGYGLPFSSYAQEGGYVDQDGNYVREKSIALMLIDPSEALLEELSCDLCAFLNQESVMLTIEDIECRFISHSLPKSINGGA